MYELPKLYKVSRAERNKNSRIRTKYQSDSEFRRPTTLTYMYVVHTKTTYMSNQKSTKVSKNEKYKH